MKFFKTAETLNSNSKTLEGKYYTDAEIIKKEADTIFFKQWLCVGRTNDVAKIGQFITLNIFDESVFILRNNENQISAYYNVCRHRGTRICTQLSGIFSKSIQCNYHGWTYNLKGELIAAPTMDKVKNFDNNKFGLNPLPVYEWDGFIFINFSDNPQNFKSLFKPLLNKFNQWDLVNLKTLITKKYTLQCNWKLVLQNFNECYHCPLIHPQLAGIHNYLGGRNDLYEGYFLGGYMEFNKNKQSITSSGSLCCPPFKNLKRSNLNRVYYYSIFPNMLLSLHPEYVMFHIIWPESEHTTIVYCSWLFSNEYINNKKYNLNDSVDFWDKTNKQDWQICEQSYLGIKSKSYSPTPYSGQESLLAAYDKYYLKILNQLN